MKIICSKANLLHGISTVSKAVPVRTTMSIQECILIDASADVIRLTANDMELGIETVVEGRIEDRGMIALNAKIFGDIVRKLPDNDVTIETENSLQTQIVCETARFNIAGKDPQDFSRLPYVEKDEGIQISQLTLKDVIRQTIFSIADNENNKMMSGELFDIRGNRLEVASLDGHRISIRNIELRDSYSDRRVIVPGKTLQEISKVLTGGADDMVDIYMTENLILFEMEHTMIVSRLIAGNYFQIEQMISSAYSAKIVINRKRFLDCIERGALLVNEADRKPVILDISEDEMVLKIHSFIGSMNESIPIEMEGKPLKIGFNPRFFMDALRVIDEEEVTLYMINPKAPCFIRDETDSYIYLILPVNFNESEY